MPVLAFEPDRTAGELSSDLRTTMALMVGRTDDEVELHLGLLPFELRTRLILYGAIAPVSPHDKPNDEPVQVRLLPFGRQLAYSCARALTDEERAAFDRRTQELQRARAQRGR